MSIKTLLGLESFPLRDVDIMHQIAEAKRKNQEFIIFSSNKQKVKLWLGKVHPEGLMRGWQDYYKDNW